MMTDSTDAKKLNIEVEGETVTPTDNKLPSYKVIPETDTEYKAVQNSNMVKENGDNCKDGADEKMLTPKGDLGDVKFISGDQQNGDAKIDILEIKQAFTGLTKEELLKFSNDPFWVRLRWVMFIGFWLLWLGMLAGAIVIIVGAPKCAPPPPKTWWQDGPLMEASAPKDDSETQWNLTTLLEKLPILSELKIKGLIVPETMLPGDDSYSVLNSETLEMTEFKTLVDKTKAKNIKLIVDLTANRASKTSEWFAKSERGEHPYKDYFIWSSSKNTNEEGVSEPPNDWLSINDETAWSYSTVRKQFYLHQLDKNKPDLNFRNPEVATEFEKVIQFWIKNGVSGVRLSHAKHLLVDQSFANEGISSNLNADLNNYDFYTHSKTSYQEGLADLLLKWKNVVRKHTDDEGVLMLDGYLETTEALKKNGTIVVDLPRASKIMDQASQKSPSQKGYTAKQFNDSLHSSFIRLGDAWPSWKFSSADKSLDSEFGIMSTLLPGVPVITLDQVLEPSSNETKVSEEYTTLLGMRELPSLKYGGYHSTLLANDTIFAFTRLKSGNPGVMVLFNPRDFVVHTNTTSIHAVPDKLTVSLTSNNYNHEGVFIKTKLDSYKIPVSPKSVIVLTYVPVKE